MHRILPNLQLLNLTFRTKIEMLRDNLVVFEGFFTLWLDLVVHPSISHLQLIWLQHQSGIHPLQGPSNT